MASPAKRDDLVIAAGSADQIDAVMHIMEAAFGDRFGEAWTRSQLSGILPMGGVFLSLAVDREHARTIGFALTRTVADEAELLLIAVLPSHHRRGIGKMLLDDFLDRCNEQKVSRAHLEVRDGNSAIAMYSEAGFAPVGRRRGYYHSPDGSKFDAITLARQL